MDPDYVLLLIGGVFGCVITALVATAFRGSDTSKGETGISQQWCRGMPIDTWRKQIGRHNDSKHGFTHDDHTLRRALLMMHTEITELRAVIAEYNHQSTEFAEELADNVIRALDFCYRSGIDIDSVLHRIPELDILDTFYGERTITRLVEASSKWLPDIVTTDALTTELHDQVTYIVNSWRKVGAIGSKHIALFLCTCFSIADKCSTDLEGAMVEKMQYNETRSRLHGKKW